MKSESAEHHDATALQILIAEHSALQAIRSGTIFEANGRTTLYLGAVSSSVVALAFIGQASEMGALFILFALILLPTLLFLGIVTFIRVYQTGVEDMIASRGMNRIRHFYTEIAPAIAPYFILSTHDDMQGMLQNMGAGKPGWWQLFVSTHGLVGVINSVLAAVFVGLLAATLLQTALVTSVVIGTVVFLVTEYLHYRYQGQTFIAAEQRLHVMFPSDPGQQQ